MKGGEGGIFSKAPDWKLFFLLKIKLQAAQEVKKIWSDQWLGKHCILRRIWAKWGVG